MNASLIQTKRSLRSCFLIYTAVLALCFLAAHQYSINFCKRLLILIMPAAAAHDIAGRLFSRMMLLEFLVLFIFCFSAFVFYRRIAGALREISENARLLAENNFSERLPHYRIRELDELAAAMNETGARLNQTIADLLDQRRKQEAVLSQIDEGVAVLDTQWRLATINDAARSLIGVDPDEEHPRPLKDIAGNLAVRQLLRQAEKSTECVEGEAEFSNRIAHIRIKRIRGQEATGLGAVMILSDVTDYKKFERARRELVANVSHELKTPVTSIKGFVETMLDGAIDDRENLTRFLHIVLAQANRLSAIIDDLLALAKLETLSVEELVVLHEEPISRIIAGAVDNCCAAAADKDIVIACECSPDLKWPVDHALIERALVNLIDNAVKYSDPGTKVTIAAQSTDAQLCLTVADQGIGIDEEHLPRIFERFYRVDKARSRKLGGTGLGLAIVQHIAGVHEGTVEVKSEAGKGSVFRILIPHPGNRQ